MDLIETPNATAREIGLLRELAEKHLMEAKSIANQLRVRHARAVLLEEFPHHTVAVFTRAWDEDKPKLLQLISGSPDVDDIDYPDQSKLHPNMTREQAVAWWAAERIILRIGSDQELAEVLEEPSEIHNDWVEFDLLLQDGRDLNSTEDTSTSEQKETP